MIRLIILIFLPLFFGCCQQSENHPVFDYYPPDDVFDEGFVSKYYLHYYPDNPDAFPGTEIEYTKYQKRNDTLFKTEGYNAGFELINNRFYSVEANKLSVVKGMGVNPRDVADTTELNILNGSHSVWEGAKEEPYQQQYEWGGEQYIYTENQLSVADTTILNKQAKVFHYQWNYRKADSDSIFNEGTTSSYFVQGIGFYGADTKGSSYRRKVELMEQMPLKEFKKQANHGEHRVAWIDQTKTISDDTDFKLCGHERRIADYYNSTPDGRYLHSKRAMLDSIYSNLDKTKLFDQSGRLVFRFVVNCEGKAGRFVGEGYDMDYQPMEFRQETVDHLYAVLQKLEDWRTVVIRDEVRDAYFYITFNIDNGEIIDILP